MPFHIIRDDITKLRVDAIVNAANPSLLGGGGVDGAIHRAAGPELREYCRTLGGCEVGQAKLSPGFCLRAKWVIHTVGPVWRGGDRGEEGFLSACYRNSLALALEQNLESVAFPLISAGAYGYPKDQALDVAVREIGGFLLEHELDVTLVVYDEKSYQLSAERFRDIRSYLDRWLPEPSGSFNNRAEERAWAIQSMERAGADAPAPAAAAAKPARKPRFPQLRPRRKAEADSDSAKAPAAAGLLPDAAAPSCPAPSAAPVPSREEGWICAACGRQNSGGRYCGRCGLPRRADLPAPDLAEAVEREAHSDLDQRLRQLDESFSQMLLRKIDERGMTDSACYKRANVDRKLFSKIRSDPQYRPSKPTVLAFAIALELDLAETRDMLMKAGFALSHSSKFDVIIEYFIQKKNYNIFEINEALFAFDQNLLGA